MNRPMTSAERRVVKSARRDSERSVAEAVRHIVEQDPEREDVRSIERYAARERRALRGLAALDR